ncbi:hypothetical protein EVAR_93549_1 [Eumeta japonica]|uniref:Uncharacterized protein n=1 Tax=Eumeta variegata TaxID=151549 RepID=A0A4C1USV8_EUMVA|nr:hypothetical protein EVAR_93549_1 [Eumeta japonica]
MHMLHLTVARHFQLQGKESPHYVLWKWVYTVRDALCKPKIRSGHRLPRCDHIVIWPLLLSLRPRCYKMSTAARLCARSRRPTSDRPSSSSTFTQKERLFPVTTKLRRRRFERSHLSRRIVSSESFHLTALVII